MNTALQLLGLFHLNLPYSTIEEVQRKTVVERCYWPLLRLNRDRWLPFGIEVPFFALEMIETLDPSWNGELRALLENQMLSGYSPWTKAKLLSPRHFARLMLSLHNTGLTFASLHN